MFVLFEPVVDAGKEVGAAVGTVVGVTVGSVVGATAGTDVGVAVGIGAFQRGFPTLLYAIIPTHSYISICKNSISWIH